MSQAPNPPDKNPYLPPKSSLTDVMAESHHHHGFRWSAALAGFATDIAATLVGGCIIGMVAGVVLVIQGNAPDEMQVQVGQSFAVNIISLIYGLLCSALGGYVAAWVAGYRPVQHALGAGAFSFVFGVLGALLYLFFDFHPQPIWVTLVGLVLVLPAAALGGLARGERRP